MAEKHPFDDFGINLFSECVMKECLPHPIYKKWKTATRKEDALDRSNHRPQPSTNGTFARQSSLVTSTRPSCKSFGCTNFQ